MFSLKELRHLIISIFVLTFAFAFDDKRPRFELEYWLTNFIYFFLTVTIVVLVYLISQKLMAYKYKANISYRIITISRFWFGPSKGFLSRFFKNFNIEYPIGIILSLLVTLFTNGRLLFLAVGRFLVDYKKHKRLGFKIAHLTEYEIAKIAIAGPLSSAILALVFKIIGGFDEIVLVSSLYAVFNMIPLADNDGSKILFGAKYLYFFILSFVLFSAVLVNLTTGLLAGVLAFIIALVIFFSLLYKALR